MGNGLFTLILSVLSYLVLVIVLVLYPELTGSKTPTSRIRGKNENCKWGTTASKYPIGSTNIQ